MRQAHGKGKRLSVPTPGRNVWPMDACPVFSPRKGYLPVDGEQCWYCRYADFRLSSPIALDVGICCYPQVQTR